MTVDDVARATEGEGHLPPERLRALEAAEADAEFVEILELLRLYDVDEENFRRELMASLPELDLDNASSLHGAGTDGAAEG